MRLVLVVVVVAACSSSSRPPAPPPTAPSPVPAAAAVPPDPHNFGFELVDGTAPRGWSGSEGATLATTTDDKHGGARALLLDRELAGSIALDGRPYANKRVTLRGYIKTRDSIGAGLWLRADAADGTRLAIDNMHDQAVAGTEDWTEVEVTLDVPANAAKLVAGAVQFGKGTAWFDDLSLAVGAIEPPAEIKLGGIVVDAAGAPVAGADVALIAPGRGEIDKHVRTDASGRFELPAIEGRWGVSAHAPGRVGAFVDGEKYKATTRELRLVLGTSGGVVVRGKLSRKPRPGTYVRISPYSDHDSDLFAVPVRDDGSFEALLPRGDEYVVAELDGEVTSSFKRTGDRVEVLLETPSFDPPPAEVVAYIGKQGIPLASAEAGTGFADMAPLGKLIGKARIVALGEATHGTREIFQMKHRFLEYLVAKHGFTVFAIEANQPECRAINDYVLHGKGSARAALAGIYFWTWNTEEVLALIEWMRAWNADPKHTKKIQFVGFDMQTSAVAHANVAAFVAKVAPDRTSLLAPIAPLGEKSSARIVQAASAAEREAIADGLAALTSLFTTNAKAWSADPAYVDARHDLRILEQAFAMYVAKGGFDERDAAMAENVGWLLDQTKARIVVWAHNGHISNELYTFKNMGSHLRAKYKRAYLNIGFLFGEGGFQAIDFTTQARVLAEHAFGPAPEHHATTAFARAAKPLLVLDLRALPKRGVVRDWFWDKHPIRELGAVYAGERQSTHAVVLPELYDALIYIDRTTRARPLAKP